MDLEDLPTEQICDYIRAQSADPLVEKLLAVLSGRIRKSEAEISAAEKRARSIVVAGLPELKGNTLRPSDRLTLR
ncbi:toxin-antitoxin system, antitoxin component, ArsR domain protein [Ancylostoma duodenale]|uniref:Toxin-antitoxin system, antitoxin component, ArsR domain protein n=1 Tax=Ancylostoma duodenale TaxID=51022 RepID=A0A0C2FGF8_9BILA|nr:toxin-antitoxin system, antitoxin component, ArsR domain protein [Ancylostoma duodenale]